MTPALSNAEAGGSVCTTPACLQLSSYILSSIAPNYTDIDPCTDFDKLACAGWASTHTPIAGRARASSLGEVRNAVNIVLRDVLEGPYPNGPNAGFLTASLSQEQVAIDRDNFKLIVDTYNACLNNTAVQAAGLRPLISLINRVAEAFPVADTTEDRERKVSKGDASNIGKALLLFNQHGIGTFELIDVTLDDQDPNQTIISVLPGGTPGLSDSQAHNNQTVEEYQRIMAAVLQEVHPSKLTASYAQKLAVAINQFERDVSALKSKDDSRADDNSPGRKFKLEQVTSVAPELNHDFVLKNLISADYELKELYFSPGYFGNLSQLVTNTSVETVQGFFMWKMVLTFSDYVEAEATERLNSFKDKIRAADPNVVGKAPRWQQCVQHVDEGVPWSSLPSGLGWILSRFYLDKGYSKESRELATNMMGSIQQAFISRLGDKDWLSSEVKKAAEEKVNAIVKKIGYPDMSPDTANPRNLADTFSGLQLGNAYFDNAVALAAFAGKKTFAQLGKPSDKAIWLQTPSTTNAYYFATYNDIIINAGIQQKPLYSPEYPAYINYGGLGMVLGHELTHGFDNNGHNYAANGSLVNWWDEKSLQAFTNRTRCFADQYQKFTVMAPNGTVVPINGNFTLGENIADAGGVVTSYAAWKKSQADKKSNNMDLPGLQKFSHDQLFFLHYAQTWCEKSSKEADVYQIVTDVHSLGFARIKGPLDNSEDFRAAFNCPQKQATCSLW
ncbi:Putative peptidase M13, metallopeptidase, catalytic domain superfamily, peptidase M13, domain 2 [Colletotrichum destructivum]|uniref:Peptidase M13, metallopeptidase, catalytic domain superfamily, peptidase M13, domain 2 n=1 Tax=Colletotrichum destructivum TaxID=34406 RepID=A0AAX4IN58_9PEZI|nr:Putative peptidase M13, metallopeptidase, catalytic domain superfamily, peptidase M13, domain 2 [Colletotrichum destructivum]